MSQDPTPRKSRFTTGLGVATALGIGMAAYTHHWESGNKIYHTPYRDVGGVLTVCDGHTGPDINAGQYYSTAECNRLLLKDILKAEERWTAQVGGDLSWIPDPSYSAFTDWALNVGPPPGNTLIKKLKAHDLKGACEQLPRWVYVNSKVYKGLVTRRYTGDGKQVSEYTLCMEGVK